MTDLKQERAREVRSHLGHLDALRGIAVLGVLAIHTGQWSPSPLAGITQSGQRGVQLFFVVSAFTLMLSGDNRKAEPHATAAFFLRRFFRLAPLYYLCILLANWLAPVLRMGWFDTALSVLFLQNLSTSGYWAGTFGAWSLGNEALFYLCLPLIYRRIRTLRAAILAFVVSIVVSVSISRILLHFYPANYDYWTFYWFVTEAPVFLMGIMTYFVWKEHLQAFVGDGPSPKAKDFSALFLLLTAAIYLTSFPFDGPRLLLSTTACVTLLVALSLYPWPLLVNRFTIFLGKISYSIYLLHFFLLWIALPWLRLHVPQARPRPEHLILQWATLYLITLLVSIGISTMTWLWVEEPGIRLGRRVIRRMQGKPSGRGPEPPLLVPVEAVTGTGNTPYAQF